MDKTNHVIIGKDNKPKENLYLKGQKIEKANTYKHLGIHHSNDGSLTYHISKVESKIKMITAKIMQLASDETLKNVENSSTLKLIDNTVDSIIMYGMEALIVKKKDLNKLDSIQYNAIRNLFAMPWATPKGILRYELGLIPIDLKIKGRQFVFIHIKKTTVLITCKRKQYILYPIG